MEAAIEYSHARPLYRETWETTAYTTFLLLKKLLLLSGTSLDSFVRDPAAFKAGKAAKREELEDLWKKATGTCTIWSINLATKLTGKPSGLILGDLGQHRAAWSGNGVVLIDSSAQMAVGLTANDKFCNETGSWRLERVTGRPKLFFKVCSLILGLASLTIGKQKT
jgi:hypothetical protein